MRIGIDIDEVIAEYVKGYLRYYNKLKGANLSYEDWHSYNFWEVFGGTKQEAIEIADKFYESEFFENIELIEGAKEALKILNEKHKLFIITSRPDKLIEPTRNFFDKHFSDCNFDITHTGDFFKNQGKSKFQICVDKGIEIMIDDNAKYAVECAEKGTKVLLLDKPWNQGQGDHKNVKRVFSWNEILEEIENAKIL